MNLYQLYANPAELKWVNEANEKIPEVFATKTNGSFKLSKKYTPEQIKAISKNPWSAYWYAKDILQHRWQEAEPYIMKDPLYAYFYAKDVLKQRWLEAEPVIMKSPRTAYFYAIYVIERRWIEAEPIIKLNASNWRLYKIRFNLN